MNLKNYTSTVPAERTVMRIEESLAEAGAASVVKDYENGLVVALCFQIKVEEGRKVTIRLPANEKAVYEAMVKARKRHLYMDDQEKLRAQARRTAWRLMQDWVEVQLSLIHMHQVEWMQVFLPYAWDGQRTFYQVVRDSGFKMLPAAKEEQP